MFVIFAQILIHSFGMRKKSLTGGTKPAKVSSVMLPPRFPCGIPAHPLLPRPVIPAPCAGVARERAETRVADAWHGVQSRVPDMWPRCFLLCECASLR